MKDWEEQRFERIKPVSQVNRVYDTFEYYSNGEVHSFAGKSKGFEVVTEMSKGNDSYFQDSRFLLAISCRGKKTHFTCAFDIDRDGSILDKSCPIKARSTHVSTGKYLIEMKSSILEKVSCSTISNMIPHLNRILGE